jgi:Flp pilus assembly protein TadG
MCNHSHPYLSRSSLVNTAGRFARSEDGATAVELAFIMPVFLYLLMAIFQIGFVFTASQILETAAADLARFTRTGQAQAQNLTRQQFQDRFCQAIRVFLPCDGARFVIDLQVLPSFGAVSLSWPVDASGNFTGSGGYSLGGGGDVVVLRVFYQYSVWLPWAGSAISDLPNGQRLLASAAAFQNERF